MQEDPLSSDELPNLEILVKQQVCANNAWCVVGASISGKRHLSKVPATPCQDAHFILSENNLWGVAVCCDGAGSKPQSHIGSSFLCKRAAESFRDLVIQNGWHVEGCIPSEEDWKRSSLEMTIQLRRQLSEYAGSLNLRPKELSCTLIVAVYFSHGLLTCHVGDGRACYQNQALAWIPMMTPFEGQDVGETAFLTSGTEEQLATIFGSTVIVERPRAFAVLSDGLQKQSYQIAEFDDILQKVIYQNVPFPGFFNPLADALHRFHNEGLPPSVIQTKWNRFVKEGNEEIAFELDDKTLILGVL